MLSFRYLKSSDIESVLLIERKAYPIPWTKSMLETSLAKDVCFGLELDGVLIGYALVSYVLDEAHLLNICIDPSLKRKGYGRRLLQFIITKALERRSTVFFLEVRESNHSAIELYCSEGFNEVGVRPNYYPAKQGREDAVLMTMELTVDQYV